MRGKVTALSLSAADFAELTSLQTADEQSAWIRARIPEGCDFADPMPILAGGYWDYTIPIVESYSDSATGAKGD